MNTNNSTKKEGLYLQANQIYRILDNKCVRDFFERKGIIVENAGSNGCVEDNYYISGIMSYDIMDEIPESIINKHKLEER